jgi:hypothetical protein
MQNQEAFMRKRFAVEEKTHPGQARASARKKAHKEAHAKELEAEAAEAGVSVTKIIQARQQEVNEEIRRQERRHTAAMRAYTPPPRPTYTNWW